MYPSKKAPSYGTFVKNFCEQLDSIGVKYDLSVANKRTNKASKAIGYFVFYISSFFKTLLGRYDIVYIHYPSYSSIAALLANKFKHRTLFVNVHGSDALPINGRQKWLEKNTRKAITIADKVIVPSTFFKQVVSEKYALPLEKMFVYPSGGVDSKLFFPYQEKEIETIRKKIGLDEEKFTVGFISRLYRAKGWDTFVSAVEKLKKYSNEMQFLIVGSGPDEEQLSKLIEDRQLKDMILRYPAQSQDKLVEYYNILDLFVFPTAAAESLGLVAVEAMACGVPVIASDFAAPKYYIQDGFNGYKFKLNDSADLARKIEQVYRTKNEIKELKRGALLTAEEYSTANCCKILHEILDN